MFWFRKKQPAGTKVVFEVNGMHCTSCSMTIDAELEEVDGVTQAETHYAKGTATVWYNPEKTSLEALRQRIESLGYSVT